MQIPFLDLERLYQGRPQLLEKAVQEVMQEGIFVGGKQPGEFEEAFVHYCGLPHAVACANGTDALELMLEGAGIGEGDEVIVPGISWIATAAAVVRVGASPVFADLEEPFLSLDPLAIPALITKKTKAVLAVHLYGQLADMPALKALSEKHGLLLFEDAAQAHGAELEGKKAGSWGVATAFSFYPTKNLGALGDAGAVLTADAAIALKVRQLGNHGQLQKHRHALIGRNSRMDSLQAAVLKAKLPLLDEWNRERNRLARLYSERLAVVPFVKVPQERAGSLHVYHLYVIRCSQRDGLQHFLATKGVQTAIHYPEALSSMAVFRNFRGSGNCPVAAQLSREALSLPLYPGLKEEELAYICEAIEAFYREA